MKEKYLNSDGTLKDNKIIMNIHKSADMYENGEILECRDLLLEIINAIGNFEKQF